MGEYHPEYVHELEEQLRTLLAENKVMREALRKISTSDDLSSCSWFRSKANAALSNTTASTLQERIDNPQIVDVDIDDLEPTQQRSITTGDVRVDLECEHKNTHKDACFKFIEICDDCAHVWVNKDSADTHQYHICQQFDTEGYCTVCGWHAAV